MNVPVKHTSEVEHKVRAYPCTSQEPAKQVLEGSVHCTLCTDRARRHANSELQTYYKDKDTVYQTTPFYIPKKNGVAERFNRTFKEGMRATLFAAKLEEEHWAAAADTTASVSGGAHQNLLYPDTMEAPL